MKPSGRYPTRLAGAVMVILLLIAPKALCSQGSSTITAIDVSPESNEVQLTIEGAIEYGYFPLSEPHRLVFDFPGTILEANDGESISEEIIGACFREISLSQFSDVPAIARLVIYLNSPTTAEVEFDPEVGSLLIRVMQDGGMRNMLSAGAVEEPVEIPVNSGIIETEVSASLEIPTGTPTDPGSAYEIIRGEGDLTVRIPGLTADDVTVSTLRFPDRLHIRMYTSGRIDDERPRFDPLARGNIWNDVARQWASFVDRDGRGVVDLTIYLYPNVGYSQSITSGSVPEIRLFPIPPTATPVAESEPEEIEVTEIEVAAYTPEADEEPVATETQTEPETRSEPNEIAEIFIAPVETVAENTAQAEETTEVVEIDQTPEAEVFSEEDTEIVLTESEDRQVSVVSAVETIEVIEDGTLVTELPDPVTDRTLEEAIAAANIVPSPGLPALPVTLRQDNLLSPVRVDTQEPMFLRVGEVVVLRVGGLVRASLGNPEVAALNVISQDELLLTALAAGSTTLLTWEMDRGHVAREINVLSATSAPLQAIADAIDDDNIRVNIIMSGEGEGSPGVILEGSVQTEEERMRAHMIASLYAGERVSNLIEVTDPRQVLVEVRVVEIDKRALDEHLSHFSAAARADNDDFTIGIITDLLDPGNPGGGMMDSRVRPGIVNGDAEDVVFDPIDIVLNELETNRMANILSRPNVVSLSGHSAHFRVGGEIPYTYLNENGVTVVEFKEFGISLDMTPLVDSSGNIMLTIAPTVRTVDMALAIAGIPGFRTREMTTEVQLRPRETLVIGGLIQNEVTEIVSEIPLLSDIPILGQLFRSRRFSEDQTELVIFLTPYILTSPEMSHDIICWTGEDSEEE